MFTKTIALFAASVYAAEVLVFEDNFDKLDFKKWQHEITMGGGGNWEFEMYVNRRQNSFVKDGVLYLQPTLTADNIGEAALKSGVYSLWGGSPADLCTSNQFYGCERTAGGTNIINPIQSARLRTVNSFNFKYGRVEVRAQLPKGDWIWPAIWMLPTD
jgi:beta-glucanase (GH16 family)